jgi:multicomponent K+:H+ antiporter subunit A
VTPFYEANAKTLTGAQDIVGAIIVDYRALDTLIEITVFSLAGMGVFTLLRFASSQAGDRGAPEFNQAVRNLPTRGIGGKRASPLVRGMADFILPAALVIAVVHVLYGHDRPGDGFTAGVIVSLALGFWYVVFGYEETKRRLRWGNPVILVGAGLGIAILNAFLPLAWGLNFAAHIDFGKIMGLSLPPGVSLSTALIFEAAIFVAVLGGTFAVLDALGHPHEDEYHSGIVEG